MDSYTAREMTLLLFFDKPECVSATSNVGDLLQIDFYDGHLFSDTLGKHVNPTTRVERRLLRQLINKTEEDVIDI